jgi:hypothetical protein
LAGNLRGELRDHPPDEQEFAFVTLGEILGGENLLVGPARLAAVGQEILRVAGLPLLHRNVFGAALGLPDIEVFIERIFRQRRRLFKAAEIRHPRSLRLPEALKRLLEEG